MEEIVRLYICFLQEVTFGKSIKVASSIRAEPGKFESKGERGKVNARKKNKTTNYWGKHQTINQRRGKPGKYHLPCLISLQFAGGGKLLKDSRLRRRRPFRRVNIRR